MGARVLLVGEDTPFMSTLATFAQSNHFDVHCADSPGEALALVNQDDIDVVVLNIKDLMAEGIRLLRALKRSRPFIEVITLSIPSSLRYSIESMKHGAFDDLLMPFDLDALMGKILEAWERRKAKKGKRTWRQRLEDLAVSVSFAEAGDGDTALRIMKDSQGSNKEEG